MVKKNMRVRAALSIDWQEVDRIAGIHKKETT